MKASRIGAAALLTSFLLTVVRAQSLATTLTESHARAAADIAAKTAAGNDRKFDSAFEAEIRKLSPDYGHGMSLMYQQGVAVSAFGPVAGFQRIAAATAKRFEPMSGVPWASAVTIVIDSYEFTAPMIDKIVVLRNGAPVEPTSSTFGPKEISNALGARRQYPSGSILYPLSAFSPGADVQVVIVPSAGGNRTVKFDEAKLRKLQ